MERMFVSSVDEIGDLGEKALRSQTKLHNQLPLCW